MHSIPVLRHRIGRMTALLCAALILIGCNAAVPATPEPQSGESAAAAAALEAYRTFGGEIAELGAAEPVATVQVSNMVGTIPSFSLTQGNPPCAGFVQTAPSLVFTLAEGAAALQIAFDGNVETALIVAIEGEKIVCDESAPFTRTPTFTVPEPGAGRYGVWVGRMNMQTPANGTLTVTVDQ
jgi:hypothetical protein